MKKAAATGKQPATEYSPICVLRRRQRKQPVFM